jgi:hypothetical protein
MGCVMNRRGVWMVALAAGCVSVPAWAQDELAIAPGGFIEAEPMTAASVGEFPLGLCPWDLPVLDPGDSWEPQTPTWVPDRRPAIFVQMWNGDFCNNPRGSAWWWYDGDDFGMVPRDQNVNGVPDVFDRLLQLMNEYEQGGWRRIMLMLPAGLAFRQEMSSSHWWGMPAWKREGFERHVKPWIDAHPEVSVGLYLNITMSDPTSICQAPNAYTEITAVTPESVNYCCPCPSGRVYIYPCAGAEHARTPDPRSRIDACVFDRNIRPWMNLGLRFAFFDASAGPSRAASLVQFAHSPAYRGRFSMGGESIPWLSHQNYNPAWIARGPWFATTAVLDVQDPPVRNDRGPRWRFNPATTEVCAAPYREPTFEEVWDWADRGYVMFLYNLGGRSDEYVKRVYSMGTIADGGDFDGSGFVDGDDFDLFMRNATANLGRTDRGFNWVHGDVTGDGLVTSDDVDRFIVLWDAGGAGTPIAVPLGEADPWNVFK